MSFVLDNPTMPLARPSTGRYAFDRFRLASDGTLLLRGDLAIPLAPKVLRTLLVLVRRAGDVVTKDELLQEVWPDCFVEETGLARNVSILRQALDDDGRRFVVTVPRVGYRFAAPVTFETSPSDAQAAVTRTRVFVGRTSERERLLDAIARARRGAGGLIAVAGEPGIGKTTVVEHVLDELDDDCVIGRGRSSEQFADAEAHLPILEALHDLAATPATSDILRRKAPTWARYLRLEDRDATAPSTSSQPAGNPQRLLRELTLFLEALARERTVVLFFDDVHWSDSATVDALAHLAPRVARIRVLVVITYRQNELALADHPLVPLRGELIARGEMVEVCVGLLTRDDVSAYVQTASIDRPLSTRMASLVFDRSEGNPLFMTALLRYLAAAAPEHQHDIPDSLRGLIDRMLRRLDAASLGVLDVAAVQGYEFDSATVAEASDHASAHVEEVLRIAERTHALVVRERETVRPDGTFTVVYRFVHALYQAGLLASLTPSRSMTHAQRVADVLVRAHAGHTDAIAGQLATLFEESRDYRQAASYFLAASRNAARLYAYANASQLAARGLHCVEVAADIDEDDRLKMELALTFARLTPLSCLDGFGSQAVERLTRRAVALSERLRDSGAMALALQATSMMGLVQGECGAARDAGARLIALAQERSDQVLLCNAHMQAQIACHHLGEFGAAAQHAAVVHTLAARLPYRERHTSIFDPEVASLAESARNLWITGHLASAPVESARAVALGRDVGHPESLSFAWLFDAWIHGYRHDWPACLQSAEAGITTAEDAGAVQPLAWNRCVRGWALAHTGAVEEGLSQLRAAIGASQAIMGEVAMPQFRAMMAEALLLRGDLLAADEWLEAALAAGQSHDDRYFAAEVYRLAALCAAARDSASARQRLHEALDIARAQGARTFELRAALSLASLDRPSGTTAVERAMDGFPEPAEWPEVLAARELLTRQPP
jgi:DNA-binding winged helix-turn-helix (wHTH) protein/tetratricopeptide (TPR) repeat protein